jgi:hypothetical protein
MLRSIFAGASALVLISLAGAAQAQPMTTFGGFVWGQYGMGEDDNDNEADVWSGGGSLAVGVYPMISLQGDVGFATTDVGDDDSLDVWSFAGSAFWRGPMFAVGANIGNSSIEIDPLDFDVMNYGAFGEFYPTQIITVYALGGWLDGDFGFDGNYLGGGAIVYPIPNLALTGNINYVDNDADDATSFGVSAEYMFSDTMPLSVYGGYNFADEGGIDVLTIGIRFLFGGPIGPLVARDRTGAIRHTGPAQIIRF